MRPSLIRRPAAQLAAILAGLYLIGTLAPVEGNSTAASARGSSIRPAPAGSPAATLAAATAAVSGLSLSNDGAPFAAGPGAGSSAGGRAAATGAITQALLDSLHAARPALVVGERLTFSIGWGVVKAGSATLEIAGIRRYRDRLAYHFQSDATSNSVFDKIYPVRDRVISLMDVRTARSLYFEKHLREGKYRADQQIRFDHEGGKAIYHDRREFPMTPGAVDVLAAFYLTRTLPLEAGRDMHFESHADRKNYPLRVRVLGREEIQTPAGRFQCLKIEPKLRSGAFFKNEGQLTIWLTDDERRLPVLMKSRIAVGSITATLTAFERPASGHATSRQNGPG